MLGSSASDPEPTFDVAACNLPSLQSTGLDGQ